MQAINLLLTGRGSQLLAPASGVDLVRLTDLQAAVSGCAPLAHTHPVSQITNFNAGVLAALAANGVPLSGVVNLSVTANGGIVYDALGIRVDSGIVSLVGHKHVAADVTNFSPAVLGVLAANGVPLSGVVNLSVTANGGIVYDALGIRVDSGIVSLVGHKHVAADVTNFSPAVLGVLAANGVPLSGVVNLSVTANGGIVYDALGIRVDSGIVSLVGHKHVAADVTNFSPAVLGVLAANGVPLSGVVNLSVTANGGIVYDALGIRVDSGIVSLVGHKHTVADITNFAGGVAAQLFADVVSTSSIAWSNNGSQLSGVVQLVSGGGLLLTGSGLMIDSGVVSLVGHTHAQLHNALTLGSSTSLALTLSGQQLSGEVAFASLSGLLNTPSGVAIDFGTGHNQVMRGDALASLSLSGVTSTLNTTTLRLGIAGTVLSGVVPLDANPPAGFGVIVTGMNGLRVRLGTDSQSAAAGNHTHSAATESADGFFAAADKIRLDTLWGESPLSGVQTFSTNTLLLLQNGQNLSGVVQLKTSFVAGQGAILADGSGLYVPLGSGVAQAAAGNHTHASLVPFAGGTMTGVLTLSGTLTIIGASTTAPLNPSGVVAWFAANVNGTNYKIPLYQ